MAAKELVQALKELMAKGIWATKDDLMREVIPVRPSTFTQLTDNDAFRIINRGNDIAVNYGKSPVYIEPPTLSNSGDERKETVGRCADFWKNDDILSDTPKRRLRGFEDRYQDITNGPFTEPFISKDDLSPPRPIKSENYFGGDFTIDLGKVEKAAGIMEGIVVNTYPNWEANFSSPTRDYPISAGKTFTKIKTIGSDEAEEVES